MIPSRLSNLREDAIGGIVSAVLAAPLAMGFGMFAFVSLGDDYFAYGAMAGLYAAMAVGVASVALGDRSTTVYAPRVTTTFILGGLLFHLVHSNAAVMQTGSHNVILAAFYAIILLGGVFQALFGLMRLGTLLRFTPQPVMAGFQNAAAALLFLVQIGNVCGFDRTVPFTQVGRHLHEIKPLSLAVAAVTFVTMWKAKAFVPKIPPLIVGLVVGSLCYFVLSGLGASAYLGPVIGLSPVKPELLRDLVGLPQLSAFEDLLPLIVGGALAVAIVAALDALLCAKLATPPTAPKVDGNALLLRLGLGNVLSALTGGITSGINIGASVSNRTFGGKTPISVVVNAAALLIVVAVLFPVVSYLPRAVLSATIMVIAIQHIDPWSIDLVQRIRRHEARHRKVLLFDLLVVVLVAVLAVTLHILAAVALGIIIAIVLFVVRMSRSNIRKTYRCGTIHSRRARAPAEAQALERIGGNVLVLELQGPLFFGSAEMLGRDIDRLAATETSLVILDARRVTDIDATGAQILAEIAAALTRKGQKLGLALAHASDAAQRLDAGGVIDGIGRDRVFDDVDRAIEWAENELLHPSAHDASKEIEITGVDVLRDLSPDELETVARYLTRATFNAGTEIFRQGEPGNQLFFVMKGSASAYLRQPDGSSIRLATFAPGTLFGELAILDAGPRSASVAVDDDLICLTLRATDFAALAQTNPAVAIKLLSGLGRQLSGRLRRANKTIHELES